MQGDLLADIEQVNIQRYLLSQMLPSPHTTVVWLHGQVGNYVVILIPEKAELAHHARFPTPTWFPTNSSYNCGGQLLALGLTVEGERMATSPNLRQGFTFRRK